MRPVRVRPSRARTTARARVRRAHGRRSPRGRGDRADRRGSRPRSGARSREVQWITAERVYDLPRLTVAQRGPAPQVRLVAAADGSPWMWNGEAWLRFDPWQETFATPSEAPEDGPDDDLPIP